MKEYLTLLVFTPGVNRSEVVVIRGEEELHKVLAELERCGFRCAVPVECSTEWVQVLEGMKGKSRLAEEILKYLEEVSLQRSK